MRSGELPTPVIAGNWKMFKGAAATRDFFDRFARLHTARSDRTVLFFPPAISLADAREAVNARPDLLLGVQNIHWEAEGAFTGETSAAHAREAGARVALIGHSERRHLFGETDEEVGWKVRAALREVLIPLICVGETLEERQAGRVAEVILRQLDSALTGVSIVGHQPLLIAYEPVWAIGTGVTATPADAAAAHRILRERLEDLLPNHRIPILYGGSVKPDNAADLLAAESVDGLLVGGASLDPAGFARIAAAG